MAPDREYLEIPLADIHPSPRGQARKVFDPERLATLAENIRRRGVKEPILVRPSPSGSGYEIVAGERRWRAARLAGLARIPAIIERKLQDDKEAFFAQVGENVHREDLNPVEEADALAAMMQQNGWSVKQAAEEMGKSSAQGYKLLRIHNAPVPIKARLLKNKLEFRTAFELTRIYDLFIRQDQKTATTRLEKVMDKAAAAQWTVTQFEEYARNLIALEKENKPARRARGERAAAPTADTAQNDPVIAKPETPSEETTTADAGSELDTQRVTPPVQPPLYTSGKVTLVLDVARIESGNLVPEERAELISIVDDLLAKLRRRR